MKGVLYLLRSYDVLVEGMMWSHQNPPLETLGMVLSGDTVVWVYIFSFLEAQSKQVGEHQMELQSQLCIQ